MTATNSNPQDVLRDEILADARRQADRMLRRARDEAAAVLAKAKAETDKEQAERLDAARKEAARRSELVLATVPVEVARRRAAQLETILQSIHDQAREQLLKREGFDYRETVTALAARAIARMEGNRFVVEVSQADRAALGEGWLEEVRRRAGRPDLVLAPASAAGNEPGVVVRDAEGRQVCDDRLLARLARLWPAMRREVAVRAGLVPGSGPRKES